MRFGPIQRVSFAAVLLLFALVVRPDAKVNEAQLHERYRALISQIDARRLAETVRYLSSFPSRVPGYDGERKAAGYVERKLREVGLTDVRREPFRLTVPIDEGSEIVVGSTRVALKAMWPNLVRTSHLPRAGVTGPLLYVGDGKLERFNGKEVRGSIVIADFNSGSQWLNAPRLGAKAVVFIEPDATMRGEAEAKFISIPINIPRFWISRSDVAPLLALVAGYRSVSATVRCRMPWKLASCDNIVATLPAPEEITEGGRRKRNPYRDQWIVISSYYDSISVVPSNAPGAESATGVAAMIEIARLMVRERPHRPVLFLATSGHYQALAGIREYLEQHLEEFMQIGIGERMAGAFRGGVKRKPPQIYLWTTLDLSTQSRTVGLFYKGWFYDYREDMQNRFSDVARVCRENADRIGPIFGLEGKKIFADGVNPVEGKNWRNHISGRPAFDCEAVTVAGGLGVTFATVDDGRALVDTPFDTYDRVNLPNLELQVKTLACLYDHILRDTNAQTDIGALRFPVSDPSSFTRIGLQNGFGRVKGRVLRFDPERSFVPNTPITGSLAVVRNWTKSYMGVRGNIVQMVDDSSPNPNKQARYSFSGMPPITAFGWNRSIDLAAYHLDPETGEIDYAPDQGVTGALDYPTTIFLTVGEKDTPVIVFKCVATAIYDLVDPQSLKTLTNINVYDGETNGEPRMYGVTMAPQNVPLQSYVEDVAVVFSQPGSRLKIKLSSGPADTRMLLLNSSASSPEGIGYLVAGDPRDAQGFTLNPNQAKVRPGENLIAKGGAISHTALYAAKDMWALDEWRLSRLRKHRIENQGVTDLHNLAKANLDKAEKALAEKNYADLDVYSRAALGYEARAYPDVQSTANDVVNGVIFYLALLLPFAFFMERLLFASRNLTRQLLGGALIFVLTFLALRFIHPAFDITGNPVIVFIAFIMGALSLIVSTFIIGKFESNLKELNKQTMGVHKADIGRMSVAFAAFGLGVSNMRRRKARTFLTCMTLVLVTFIVLSFTSIVNILRFNQVSAPGDARYSGLMVRTPMWEQLQESAYRMLRDEFKDRAVAPRAWFFGTQAGEQSNISLKRADREYVLKAIVGSTPDETRVTRPQEALIAGRWFTATDVYAAVLPKQVADALKVDIEDVGKAKVSFSGQDYLVVGILDSNRFKRQVVDLDSESLTPVDFIMMERMQRQGRGGGGANEGFREYVHLEPDTCFFIPYNTIMNLGGDIRSIGIEFATPTETQKVMKNLMPRLGLNLYAVTPEVGAEKPRIVRYSTIAATSSRGLEMVIIPVAIAAVIVLNTMIGAVFERVKEISIFSAIGLAPNHIAMLFFAESLVYAIIGSVAGYFVAQFVAKLLTIYPIAGLYLNFSSTSAVMATVIVVAVVLLSTIYPARKASQVATPALDRTWKVPDPDGDVWKLPLPFSVTRVQASGLAEFLCEWFAAYEEYSIGDFVTQDVSNETYETDNGAAYKVECTCWVAPFDLGVSQKVQIYSTPTEMPDVYELGVELTRLSGDIANWKRVNGRFLNTLRKQFLIWRTLRAEDRERYLAASTTPAAEPSGAS